MDNVGYQFRERSVPNEVTSTWEFNIVDFGDFAGNLSLLINWN